MKKTLIRLGLVGLVMLCPGISFAKVYLRPAQAIEEIFLDFQDYKRETHTIDGQKADVFRVFKGDNLIGWAVALNEKGLEEPITFLVGIDSEGKVMDVYVLEYRETHGFEIMEKSFMKQFQGRTIEDPLAVGKDIDAVTKATISSKAAAAAVKKALQVISDLGKQ